MIFSRLAAASLDDVKPSVYHTKKDPLLSSSPKSAHYDMFAAISEFFRDMQKYTKLPMNDDTLSEIEGLVALFITLQGCTDYLSMTSAIFLYARKFFSTSVTVQIVDYVQQIFAISPQSGPEDCPADPDWLTMMKASRDNWEACRNNRLFSNFSKLLGLLVTAGMCKASDVTFSIKDFVVFEPDMRVVHGNAIDVADAAFSTITFFVENMHEAFKTKSLRCFITGDKSALQLDEEYVTIVKMWDLVKNGNLTEVTGTPESEFDDRLEKLITQIRNLLGIKNSWEKKLLSDKMMKLLGIKNDYITLKISSGVRAAPFVIELFGASSQGKTTFGDQIVDALLVSAGLPLSKEFRATYNASDKYMSIWSTKKEVLTVDDFVNVKSGFVEGPPTRIIVDVCNNQPFYANMADLERKGKVFVQPSLVIVNTNTKDLDAYVYSNNPYSIQRRMNVVITVQAKKEFQIIIDSKVQGLDSKKVQEHYAKLGTVPLFDDIWELKVERAIKPAQETSVAKYDTIEYRGKPMDGVSFETVLQYLIEEFQAHRKSQDFILNTVKNRSQNIEVCGVEGCRQIKGYCHKHKFEKQSGFDLCDSVLDSMQEAGSMVKKRILGDFHGADRALAGMSTCLLMSSAKLFCKHWDWLSLIPTPWMRNRTVQNALMALDYPKLRTSYIKRSVFSWLTLSTVATTAHLYGNRISVGNYRLGNGFSCAVGLSCLATGLTVQKYMGAIVQSQYRAELLDRNTIAPALANIRDENVTKVCKAFGIIGALYAVAKLYRRWVSIRKQGSLEPKSVEDILERDSEDNPWCHVAKRSVPKPNVQLCTVSDDLCKSVEKNLVYGTIIAGNRKLQVNCLFLKSNVLLMPSHYFETDELDCTFRKVNPNSCGGKFAMRLHRRASILVPNTDLCVCYATSGGSFKDLTPWLPLENPTAHEFSMLWRAKSGELTHAYGITKPCKTSNGVCDFDGGEYQSLSISTRPGLCGAVLVSRGKGSCILGFHLGGVSGTPVGCYGCVTQLEVYNAISLLRKREGVVISGTAEQFEKQVLGKEIVLDQPLHNKSAVNFMPNNSQIEYLGSNGHVISSHSDAKVTLISEHVSDVMDSPNIYCGPVMKPEWFGWQKCLANMSSPALPFPYETLEWSIIDYKSALLPIFSSSLWNNARPLDYTENLCGLKGVKFIDPIKLDTSMGFPLTGPKRNYVEDLEPTEEFPNRRRFIPQIDDEIRRCEECYYRGERAYTIAKACKKDEILSKEKCRIFFSNPLPLTFLVRKFYLPLLRVLQMNPLASECAVGINSHGPEWDQFHKHVLTFGEDRILGGDYGKYDQKLPSQMIFAALRILCDFARECDYTEDDIRKMEAMAGDIVFAYIQFNGDLIGLTEGSHISGNSLTVIINGICGSLNLRAAYYTLLSRSLTIVPPFRHYVKLMTYGDDNIGSISRALDGFNIKYVSEFLAQYGQTYTMPNKTDDITEFLPMEDFEFLKRKSVFCPDKNVYTGALIDASIYKMLHMYLRPKGTDITEEWASAQNIDTALREWFNHGREVYEMRRQQLREVADRANLTHLCTCLNTTYDEALVDWVKKYEPWRLTSDSND